MEPDHMISIRRGLRWVIAVSLVASAALLIVGAVLRSLDGVRAQILLTFVGLLVGALLAVVQVRSISKSPRWVVAGIAAIVISQMCYLLLVWTGWTTQSLLWRVWWIAMVAALTSTHMLAWHAAAVERRDLIERGTPMCIVALALVVMGFALYRDLPPQPGPIHGWLTVLLAGGALVGSVVGWRRRSQPRPRSAGMSRGAKIAWLCVSHIVLLLLGWYVGRTAAPAAGSFEMLPSALAGLSPQQVDTQVRADLERLKTIVSGVNDLARKAAQLESELAAKMVAEQRDY